MVTTATRSELTIESAIDSYRRHLRAGGMTPVTVGLYIYRLRRFDAYLRANGMPTGVTAIRREHIESYIVSLQEAGYRPATISLAYRSIQPFWRWLVSEDELRSSPMERMTSPRVPLDAPPVLREEQMEALLTACSGTGFDERRDTALLLLLYDTGMRRGEIAALQETDIDWLNEVVIIRAGTSKSRRGRTAPFGRRTAKAL